MLLRGLKEYIADGNRQAVETMIRNIKEELEFDCEALNHLHLAIYLLQDSVLKVFLTPTPPKRSNVTLCHFI